MTNRQLIEAMTDMELAQFLFDRGNGTEYCYGICAHQDECRRINQNEKFCIAQIMKWLRKENDSECTVDVVPVKHGRWIKMTGMMPPEYHGHYECSECGWHMKGLRNSWTREEEMAYCPHCGAAMTEGSETDEAISR
jgi:DNA-directed RNA polymerase subunit RPC12/RpoP